MIDCQMGFLVFFFWTSRTLGREAGRSMQGYLVYYYIFCLLCEPQFADTYCERPAIQGIWTIPNAKATFHMVRLYRLSRYILPCEVLDV